LDPAETIGIDEAGRIVRNASDADAFEARQRDDRVRRDAVSGRKLEPAARAELDGAPLYPEGDSPVSEQARDLRARLSSEQGERCFLRRDQLNLDRAHMVSLEVRGSEEGQLVERQRPRRPLRQREDEPA